SIDGGPETNVDLYAPTDQGDVLAYTSPAVAAGSHTLKVRVTGAQNPNSSGTAIAIDRFNVSPNPFVTPIDDAAQGTAQNQIAYAGSWTSLVTGIPGAYNGTVSVTDTANDTASLSFTGTQVRFYTVTNYNRGIAAVSVDGSAETNVDLYAPTAVG